ncbi:MAG: emrA [Verrucomicrobiaceae bacterium]|nr:emrA [Verrucomicrobiaceae bacterium]
MNENNFPPDPDGPKNNAAGDKTANTPSEQAPLPPVPSQPDIASPEPVPQEGPSAWMPPKLNAFSSIVAITLAVVGVLVVLYAWRLPPFTGHIQNTDNAYVRGQTTVVSPQLSGYITTVAVRDFDTVQAGQPLAQIDDRIFRQRVEQARAARDGQLANLNNYTQNKQSRAANLEAQGAALANAQAQLERARADLKRVDELVTDGSVSQRERDQTVAALHQAAAAVEQAKSSREIARQDVKSVDVNRAGLEAAVANSEAALHLAEIDLANTAIIAPRAGRLSEIGVRVGQYVTAGSQLMFLVPQQVWVIANYKEEQTAHIVPGQPVRFRVDALDNQRINGHVEQLSPAAGSEFAVLRPDNATGNFVKVAQRIAVRISIDPDQPLADRLRPGMSVEASVDTRNRLQEQRPQQLKEQQNPTQENPQ